jgi:hypothetical protein
MPRITWPLVHDRPSVRVLLTSGGQPITLTLLADTGAGSNTEVFDLILEVSACRQCGSAVGWDVSLSGAYAGRFPLYALRVQVPALRFDADLLVVGVPVVPDGFEGTACFRFLNRFIYGNFGNTAHFGLER